jgi:hypothetical protein
MGRQRENVEGILVMVDIADVLSVSFRAQRGIFAAYGRTEGKKIPRCARNDI